MPLLDCSAQRPSVQSPPDEAPDDARAPTGGAFPLLQEVAPTSEHAHRRLPPPLPRKRVDLADQDVRREPFFERRAPLPEAAREQRRAAVPPLRVRAEAAGEAPRCAFPGPKRPARQRPRDAAQAREPLAREAALQGCEGAVCEACVGREFRPECLDAPGCEALAHDSRIGDVDPAVEGERGAGVSEQRKARGYDLPPRR
mmetsp:Transcript_28791/g.97044  ORF Transcript_28791/g.97044 Transcript_28791/m.97044 type:complete len:200 (+) Transcript_28791:549-1148(+)